MYRIVMPPLAGRTTIAARLLLLGRFCIEDNTPWQASNAIRATRRAVRERKCSSRVSNSLERALSRSFIDPIDIAKRHPDGVVITDSFDIWREIDAQATMCLIPSMDLLRQNATAQSAGMSNAMRARFDYAVRRCAWLESAAGPHVMVKRVATRRDVTEWVAHFVDETPLMTRDWKEDFDVDLALATSKSAPSGESGGDLPSFNLGEAH